MTRFLASVISVEEAGIALECGADIIDCKNPSSGALGALSNEVIAEIVKLVTGRCPVSATIGDLAMEPDVIREAAESKIATGADFVKIGIFRDGTSAECIEALAPLANRTDLIAVQFADQQPNSTLLPLIASAGFAGVMLDTANKSGGGLMSHASYALLARFVSSARELGLITGLAGSLKIEDIPLLLELCPDYLGFRSALCAEDRTSSIARAHVTAICRSMHAALPAIDR